MPIDLTISNKQRAVKVPLTRLTKSADELLAEIVRNLSLKPAKHLSKKELKRISERGNLSLTLVSNATIKKLNKEWRGKNSETDVLSFSMLDGPSILPGLELADGLDLGEVVISIPKAKEQARAYGHSFHRELCFLFVHGVLHVLGFDHETAAQEKDMFGRQAEILEALGITR